MGQEDMLEEGMATHSSILAWRIAMDRVAWLTTVREVPKSWTRPSTAQKLGLRWGRDSQGVWDGHGLTAVFNMENQQGPAVQRRGLCSMLCGSLDGRGVLGRVYTRICMAECLRCSPETITTLVISYTSIQNKKFKQ